MPLDNDFEFFEGESPEFTDSPSENSLNSLESLFDPSSDRDPEETDSEDHITRAAE